MPAAARLAFSRRHPPLPPGEFARVPLAAERLFIPCCFRGKETLMLVLSRRIGEKILFPGFETSVQVVDVKRGTVRLGIQAPRSVTILREEIPDRQAEGAEAGPAASGEVRQLLANRLNLTA